MSNELFDTEQTPETPTPETVEPQVEETGEDTEPATEETEESAKADDKPKRGRPPKAPEPEWADDTTLKYDESIQADYHAPEEIQKEFIAFAKEHKISVTNAEKLLNFQAQLVAKQEEQHDQLIQEELKEIRSTLDERWGEEAKARLDGIANFVKERAGEDVQRLIFNTSFGANLQVIEFLDSLVQDLGEPQYFSGSQAPDASPQGEWNNLVAQYPSYKNAVAYPHHADYQAASAAYKRIFKTT
jgi:hypothetical protein